MRYLIGIDEVGRGALAGPVVVAAAMVGGADWQPKDKSFGALKDSKKLSAKQREAWYGYFLAHPKVSFAVARVYPRQIEKRNISGAANLAALRVYKKIASRSGKQNKVNICLDGGLYLANKQWQALAVRCAETLVKADEKVPAVSIASIIAKVHRDRYMRKLAKKYPAYGFEIHKGYGTKIHRDAIKKNGPCAIHRLTFIKKWNNL